MQLFRLADSTELNNACIVGLLAAAALVAMWPRPSVMPTMPAPARIGVGSIPRSSSTISDRKWASEDDLAKALHVISEVSARLPAMMPAQVIEAPQVKGIETIGASSLLVRIETKVGPGAHYDVKRTLNRMLVDAFNANHLEIPYPKAVEIAFDPRPAGTAAEG